MQNTSLLNHNRGMMVYESKKLPVAFNCSSRLSVLNRQPLRPLRPLGSTDDNKHLTLRFDAQFKPTLLDVAFVTTR